MPQNNATITPWSIDRVEALIAMQAAGNSFSEIGAAIGLNRCAVAGKCKRLGLTAVTVDPAIQAARNAAGVARRMARIAALEPQPVIPLNIHFLDRSRFECSYLTGPQTACGNPVVRGSCCAGHAMIVYQKPVRRAA